MNITAYTINQRPNGKYVGRCRLCGQKEVHDEAAWSERLISLHVEQRHGNAQEERTVADYQRKAIAAMEESQALLAGMLLGQLTKISSDPNAPILIDRVDPITDEEGNYSNMIRVTMQSGAVYIVHVTETA